MVREDFLQQNAFTDVDGYSSYDRAGKASGHDPAVRPPVPGGHHQGCRRPQALSIPSREQIGRAKSVPVEEYPKVYEEIAAKWSRRSPPSRREGGEDA